MKAVVSTKSIYIVGAIIIGLMILIASQNIIQKLVESDLYYKAKLNLLGIRNNILLASTLESGAITYTPVAWTSIGWDKYRVSTDSQFVSLVILNDDGTPRTDVSPLPLPHYTPNIVQKDITAREFCIVKKYDADCNLIVELCEKGTACCNPQAVAC